MDANEARDWSSLPDYFIDAVVKGVIKARRWCRDGPSLRLLNREWCNNINRYVTNIRPRSSKLLCCKDGNSLSKFPNVTTVHLTPFVSQHVRDHAVMVRQLAEMRFLTRLKIDLSVCAHFWLTTDLTPLSQLKDLHLECLDEGFLDEVRSEVTDRLRQFPMLRKLSIQGGLHLRNLPDCFPHLKHLSILHVRGKIPSYQVPMLNSLESFHIGGMRHNLYPETLALLLTLKEISIRIAPCELEPLANLHGVETLRLAMDVSKCEPLVDITPLSSLHRLETLGCYRDRGSFFKLSLNAPLEALRSITLAGCRFSSLELRNNLPRLAHLTVQHWSMSDSEDFTSLLWDLRTIYIEWTTDRETALLVSDIAWSHEAFPHLTSLCLGRVDRHSVCFSTLFSLTRLEKLTLPLPASLNSEDIDEFLERIDELKQLRQLFVAGCEDVILHLSADFLDQLEVLTLYDEGFGRLPQSAKDRAFKHARTRAPHLLPYIEGRGGNRILGSWAYVLWQ